MRTTTLPIPPHYHSERVGELWRVAYQARATDAAMWCRSQSIFPSGQDTFRVCLLLIDVQNTFCIPDFELFVGGVSGRAAVEDNRRLCTFIYRHLASITRIMPTMDTHRAMQIFHSLFFVDADGHHPAPFTPITTADVAEGRWRFNAALCDQLGLTPAYGQQYLEYYVASLERDGKYALTVWPYHAMLGGIGHALVPAVEEAVFFHSMARSCQPDIVIKGTHALTEHYSALGPEVERGPQGETICTPEAARVERLHTYDAVIVAGQAKSHCVAWTVADLVGKVPEMAGRLYLLEDCTSPIVVPGGVDFTAAADEAFARFAAAGVHRVRSIDALESWPGRLGEAFAGNMSDGSDQPLDLLNHSFSFDG